MPDSIRTFLAVLAWIVACVIAAWLGAVMAMAQLPQPMLTDEKEPQWEVQKKQLVI